MKISWTGKILIDHQFPTTHAASTRVRDHLGQDGNSLTKIILNLAKEKMNPYLTRCSYKFYQGQGVTCNFVEKVDKIIKLISGTFSKLLEKKKGTFSKLYFICNMTQGMLICFL